MLRSLAAVRVSVALTLAVPAAAPLLAAPQGATREDRAVVRGLEDFTAGAQPDGLPRSVDLRPWLPAVGRQTMNDCAAWAFGYAGRSYLEALDQGWKPNGPATVFSPTFIYNQVNGGIDKGSRVDKVLELLMTKGAATLATAPYLAKDHLTQPNARAAAEAEAFRIANFGVLQNGEGIRLALAEGQIVLCCVRTNPVFSSGRYPVYTPELHAKGQAARRPDQPHGFHAMAIVGYSDDRQAFLFMNSWGTDWGDGGFVWVGYDVLGKFNRDGITEELMDFALVMVDRREPVERVEGTYRLLKLDELQAFGFGTFAGYDEAAAQGAYRYSVALRGPNELLAKVKAVTWDLPGPGGARRELRSESAASGFRVSGRSGQASFRVAGRALLDTGHETDVALDVAIPEASKRALALERVDSFYSADGGQNLWRWTLLPRMSDADWRDLASIEWQVAGNGGRSEAVPVYRHEGALPPAWSPDSSAMPSFRTAEPVAGTAVLTFTDGTRHELPVPAEPFTDPVRKELGREVVWRPVGVDGDRSWYFYEIRIRYPEAWADNLLGVRIGLGNNVDWHSAEATQVGGPGPWMHVQHGYARRPFAPGALAWFRERHPTLGQTTPVTSYEILRFGDDVAWTEPELTGDVLRGGHGFGIESRDRYVGEVDGKPVWDFEVYVDGTANIMAVQKARWTLPDGEHEFERDSEIEDQPGPLEGYVVRHRSGEPFDVNVLCTLWDGQTFELSRTIRPYAPRNDAFALDLTDITPQELRRAAPERVVAEVRLAGATDLREGLREVVGYSRRAWGGVLPQRLGAFEFNVTPPDELGRVELPRDEAATFVLHYDDGSAIALDAVPHALVPEVIPPRLQLIARERFVDWKDGVPRWSVELAVRGDVGLLREVERVEWAAVAGDGCVVPIETCADPLRAQGMTSGPCRVTAVLHFAAGVDAAPQTVRATVRTLCRRDDGPLTVRRERGWVEDPLEKYGPNVDPWAIEYPSTPWRFRLQGSAARLARLAAVRWIVRDPWAEQYAADNGEQIPAPEVHEVVAGEGARDFAWATEHYPDNPAVMVKPQLVFHDGSTLDLAEFELSDETAAEPLEHGAPALEVRDWGDVDGARAALVIGGVPARREIRRLLRTRFDWSSELLPVAGLPAATFERPAARRAFLAFDGASLPTATLNLRVDHDMGFEEEEVRIDGAPSFTMPAAIRKPGVHVEAEQVEGGAFWFLTVRAPESLLARTARVEWCYLEGGAERTRVVGDRLGERSDGFELRLSGPRPGRVRARLFDAEGAPLGEELTPLHR